MKEQVGARRVPVEMVEEREARDGLLFFYIIILDDTKSSSGFETAERVWVLLRVLRQGGRKEIDEGIWRRQSRQPDGEEALKKQSS